MDSELGGTEEGGSFRRVLLTEPEPRKDLRLGSAQSGDDLDRSGFLWGEGGENLVWLCLTESRLYAVQPPGFCHTWKYIHGKNLKSK